jgi:hypothetical protein
MLFIKKNGFMTRRRTRRRNGFDEDDDAGRTTATPEEEERRDEKKTASSFNGTVRPFVASEHPVTPAVRYTLSLFITNYYSPRAYLIYSNTKTQEAYGFVGIVASSLLFLFHLLLLFSPPLTDSEEEYKKESALFRFVSFSKHHAKALPLWMTLCVMLYVVLVECSSRMKVYDLGDGRLLTHTKKKKSECGSKSGQFVGQSVSASAWNEALFSGKKKSR